MSFRGITVAAFSVFLAASADAAIVEPAQPTTASTINVVIWWVPCSTFTNYSIVDKVITVNFSCVSGSCVVAPYYRISVGRLEAGEYTVRAVCNGTELVSSTRFTVTADIPALQPVILTLLAVSMSFLGASLLRRP